MSLAEALGQKETPRASVTPWGFVLCKCEALSSNLNQKKKSWVLVAHAYNPSYSGGKDQEDHGSQSAWANSL
jgi:hypothetical protein